MMFKTIARWIQRLFHQDDFVLPPAQTCAEQTRQPAPTTPNAPTILARQLTAAPDKTPQNPPRQPPALAPACFWQPPFPRALPAAPPQKVDAPAPKQPPDPNDARALERAQIRARQEKIMEQMQADTRKHLAEKERKRREDRVTHPIALYYDDEGREQTIEYIYLNDPQTYAYLQRRSLFTDDGQHRLYMRLCANRTHHFWLPPATAANANRTFDPTPAYGEDNDSEHETRIQRLVSNFKGLRPDQVMTIDWDGNKDRFVLADIKDYDWRANRTQFSFALGNVRPDIIGSSSGPISERAPQIFIEVVKTHFPSEPTWRAYLDHSRDHPFVVLFDFTHKPNYFLQACTKDRETQTPYRHVRTIYYIAHGRLWCNAQSLENDVLTSTQFRLRLTKQTKRMDAAPARREATRRQGRPHRARDPS